MARSSTPDSTRKRTLSRVRRVLACGALLAASVAASVGGSQAASSNVTVTLDVLSATTLTTSGCPVASQTFGSVLPGTSAISGLCNVTFGSSNNSSRLMMYQLDGAGDAMHREADASIDTSATSAFDDDGAAPYDGKISMEFPEGDASAKFAVQQADGKFVLGGTVVNGGGQADNALVRFNANGTPDTSYGGTCGAAGAPSCVAGATGRTVVTLNATEFDQMWRGILQSDGKLVTVGSKWVGGFDNDCVVMRFTTAGLLDSTFGGGDGIVTYSGNPGGGWDECRGLTQLRDGRFMTSGNVWDGGGIDTVLGRIRADGTMDSSFDGDGVLRIDVGGVVTDDGTWSIFEVDGSKVLLVGNRTNGGDVDVFVARYNLDGTVDAGYGVSAGRTDLEWAVGAGNDQDGQSWFDAQGNGYIAARTNITGDDDMVVYRMLASGLPDPTWGGGTGKVRHVQAGRANPAYGLLQQGSKVLLIGADAGGAPDGNAQVLRMTSSGIDSQFNGGAPLIVDFNSQWDYATHATLARDGRAFITSTVGKTATGKQMMGGFLLGGGTTVPDYGTDDDGAGDGDGDGDSGLSNWAAPTTQSLFAACLEARAGTNLTAGWTVDPGGSCTASDADPWYPIEDTLGAPAKVLGTTTVDASTTDVTVGLRFGVKASTRQGPGNYLAPLGLEVLAPDA